jgi:uncharacterized membrane protein YtjA (UPF0391 family)
MDRCARVAPSEIPELAQKLRAIGYLTTYGAITMLYWAVIFFVFAIVAAALGFGGIAGAAAGIAQVLFFVFLALLFVSAVATALRGRPPV